MKKWNRSTNSRAKLGKIEKDRETELVMFLTSMGGLLKPLVTLLKVEVSCLIGYTIMI